MIWAKVKAERDVYEGFGTSSVTELSSSQSHSASAGALKESKKMLVAATIEQRITQLTSSLSYDKLLIFFLTYRTYVSAVDLRHLLICRFHWALGEAVTSRDEMVRRMVRVRTITAIRYWLLTFFNVDFVPNRELRLLCGMAQLPSTRSNPAETSRCSGECCDHGRMRALLTCFVENCAAASQGDPGLQGRAHAKTEPTRSQICESEQRRPSVVEHFHGWATAALSGLPSALFQ